MTAFRLAPMSMALALLSFFLLLLPPIFFGASHVSPAPVSYVMFGSAVFMVLLYVSVWLGWRPTGFEVDDRTLRIIWPVRTRAIDRADIEGARIVSSGDLRREYGYGMRFGMGGLWGSFGLLRTDEVTFSMWVSRTDRFVLVDLRGGRPLLVTPEDPERFVELLRPRPGF